MKLANALTVVRSPALFRTDHELAFLPAALEIMETPPSPIGRMLGASIIALFCIGLGWACVGSVDIIATATGKIVPSASTKLIQPYETGVVRAIHIRDGQHVKKGDVLIELDPTMTEADVDRARSDLIFAELDAARLRALTSTNDNPLDEFKLPAGIDPTLVEKARQYLKSQLAERNSKLAALDQQRTQKVAERDTIAAGVNKLEATVPLLQERMEIRKYLYGKELGSKITYLSDLQDLVGQQKELLVQQSRLKEADAAIAGLTDARAQAAAEYRRNAFDDLAKADQKVAGLKQDLIKAAKRSNLQALTAPVDGVVQQVTVHTIGGVVTPAQALAVVVPEDGHLEIDAMVNNRDIGFVSEGQDAKIKVDTFSFTRYGLLHGRVISISGDAIVRDKPTPPTDTAGAGSGTSSSEPKGQDLSYSARLSLDERSMDIDGREVNLSPGMAVTAEIVTGRRKIISYLLSPIAKYTHDVLHER
jgi:hemolysin D